MNLGRNVKTPIDNEDDISKLWFVITVIDNADLNEHLN